MPGLSKRGLAEARKSIKSIMLLSLALAAAAALSGIAVGAGLDAGTTNEPPLPDGKTAPEPYPSLPADYGAWKLDYIKNHSGPSDFSPGPDDQYLMTGITDGGQGPFSPEEFVMVDSWQEIIDGALVHVWAGSYGSNQDQGVLLVSRTASWKSTTDHGDVMSSLYDAPAGAGALRIVDWSGSVLTITSASGGKYSFDVTDGKQLLPF